MSNDEDLRRAISALRARNSAEIGPLVGAYVQKHAKNVAGLRLLAETSMEVGLVQDAERLLEMCLNQSPDFDLARLNYGAVLCKLRRYDKALNEIETLLAKSPDKPEYLVQKADILVGIGEIDLAIDIYQALARELPHQSEIKMSLGNSLKTVGKQAEAIEAYRGAIANNPSLGVAYWSLANLKTFQFSDDEIEAMKSELGSGRPTGADLYHLSFALGSALEDGKDYDAAFQAYVQGNKAKRNHVRLGSTMDHKESLGLQAFFTTDYFSSISGQGEQRADPIFIVGLPRAGSTLLEQILASHSQVEGTAELPDIIALSRRLKRNSMPQGFRYPDVLAQMTGDALEAMGRSYLESTQMHRTDKPYFIDKMPNNFTHIGLISSILPNAKIVDARRHPMACCFSGYKQLFATGQSFSYSLEDIGRYYRNYVDLMDHWDKVLPGKILRVHYEDVLSDTEAQTRRVLEYCGLDFEENCLSFYETDRAVKTASSEQVRKPIYQSSKEQWRFFEDHLEPLKQALGPVLDRYSV